METNSIIILTEEEAEAIRYNADLLFFVAIQHKDAWKPHTRELMIEDSSEAFSKICDILKNARKKSAVED